MNYSFAKQLFLLVATATLISCEKDEVRPDIYKGAEVNMGNGKAASWISVINGVPQEVGIELTHEAFNGLTTDPTNFAASTFALPVDQRVKDFTPFDHIVLNWAPQGHEPANVFTVPHFDVHFYMMTQAERMAIPPYMPASAAMHDNMPPAGFMPASYQPTPGGVPQMGKHWGDQHMHTPFTHTMIYGSYNGKVNFLEPMVTKDILQGGQTIRVDFAQPANFQHTGKFYPTKYNFYRDGSSGKHYITLSDFVKR